MTRIGTRYEEAGGRLARIVDRTGAVHAEVAWRGDALARLVVPGAVVRGEVIEDDLLGAAHAIEDAAGARRTTMSALDWARPTEIPAIAAPGRLPPGAGAALLNTIAVLAQRAGVPALRYAGPYPTRALWISLGRSFRTTGTEDELTRDALDRAARLARDPIPIDFTPAPHERLALPGVRAGHVELRDGIERAVLDGVGYEPGGSPARLVTDGAETRAEVWFGDAAWAHVATFAEDGSLVDGPHPIRSPSTDLVGKEFPAPLRAAIAELVGEAVPAPLADDARRLVTERALRWGDLGARAAARDDAGFVVHAAIWERLAPAGLGRVALALAEALAPAVTQAIVAELGPGLASGLASGPGPLRPGT